MSTKHTNTITVSVDGGDPEDFRLTEFYLRTGWGSLPVGASILGIDYRRGNVVLLEKRPRGQVVPARTVAPLADSGDDEPHALSREDVLSLFRDDEAASA